MRRSMAGVFGLAVWIGVSGCASWTSMTIPSKQDFAWTVSKGGRGAVKAEISGSSDDWENFHCAAGSSPARSAVARSLKVAAERSAAIYQVGAVVDYQDSMDKALKMMGSVGVPMNVCVWGISAVGGAVDVEFGSTFSGIPRLITITPDDAKALGDWLLASE